MQKSKGKSVGVIPPNDLLIVNMSPINEKTMTRSDNSNYDYWNGKRQQAYSVKLFLIAFIVEKSSESNQSMYILLRELETLSVKISRNEMSTSIYFLLIS